MNHSRTFVVDTSVLLDDPDSLFKLRNGSENQVFVPYHVLLELNKFKKDPRLGHIVARVIRHLSDNRDQFTILAADKVAAPLAQQVDNHILDEIHASGLDTPVLVTNDKILQLQASLHGIRSENYKDSMPFKSEAEYVTGFVDQREDAFANCFMWGEAGKPVFFGNHGEKVIDYQHKSWNVTPRNIYQNPTLELMTDATIPIVSVQSQPGYGKSLLALAAALYLVLEKKACDKIFVVKPMLEIGQKLGYLPGRVEEKMEPYTRYVRDLVMKLHKMRPANRVFSSSNESPLQFNTARFELLPLTFIRGMNIANAVVIVDEIQNMSRSECRALLSRMGEGVKCFCLGDTRQVDHPCLNAENNGLNLIVSKSKGNRCCAHLVLKGDKSRWPDLLLRATC